MPKNATFLTQSYPDEKNIWTPLLARFFAECHPNLPVYHPIAKFADKGPWYSLRKVCKRINFSGEILKEPSSKVFLNKIDELLGRDVSIAPGRILSGRDIAGIFPDLAIVSREEDRVFLIENKPFDESKFTPAQVREYVELTQWFNSNGIACELIVAHSCSWKKIDLLYEITSALGNHYASLLYEDVFWEMSRRNFKSTDIAEPFGDYVEKGSDVCDGDD